jgi:hypothetical protein
MAKEYIKNNDGTETLIGSTTDYIPVGLPTSRINKIATTASSVSWWPISLSQIAGAEQPFCTVTSDGKSIRIEESGVYAIHSLVGTKSTNSGNFFEIRAILPNNTEIILAETYYSSGDVSFGSLGCPCVSLEAGTLLFFMIHGNTNNYVTASPIEICKLVSGPSFQFNNEGNSFPDIYSLNETRVGTWIDGKPIYKRTFNITSQTTAGNTKKDILYSDGYAWKIIKHESIITFNNNWITFPLNSTDAAGTLAAFVDVRVTPGSGTEHRIWFASVISTTFLGMDVYTTVYYTKVTD